MSCLSREQIAMAASHAYDHDEPHLAGCDECRAAVTAQRQIRDLIRRTPAPPLPRDRREAIAAEVMAQSDVADLAPVAPPRRRSGTVVAGAAAAAAAALALALWPRGSLHVVPLPDVTAGVTASEPVSLAVRGVAQEDMPVAPEVAPAVVRLDEAADFTRSSVDDRDVIALRGGGVTLDARDTRDIEVAVRDATVRVDRAKVRVVARAGAIESVTVFAGSVEVTAAGRRTVIEAGMVWVPGPIGPATALAEFRAGWAALRGGEHRIAIAAFDRASDPVVAEDAVYWAAVATERAGDRAGAARRFTAFAAQFPASPRLAAARRALARLAPP